MGLAIRKPSASLSGSIAVARDGIAWTVRADLVDELLPVATRIATGAADGDALEIVKHGPHRTVYRASLPAGGFYFKHFRVPGIKTLLLSPLRPSKAEREWSAAREIARLGLPTFEPVAWGRVSQGGIVRDSFLISREIADAIPLDELIVERFRAAGADAGRASAGEQSELRRQLAAGLGKLTARLHAAGIEHADLHAANVLVQTRGSSGLELWLIDLHRVYFKRSLAAHVRYRNLAVLHQFFVGRSTRADRLRFYRHYVREWRELNAQARGTVSESSQPPARDRPEIALLEELLATGALRGWKRADRAWRRGNRHVRKLRLGTGHARGLATLDQNWLTTICQCPEQLFGNGLVRWHKQTARCRVAEVAFGTEPASGLAHGILKCVEPHRDWRMLLSPFRFSPVRRAWEMGHALRRRGIDTPCPILFAELRDGGRPKNYLLTECIGGSLTAAEFFRTAWPALLPSERRKWLAARLGRLALQLRRLHDSGFDHRDLKFPNLLVSNDPGELRVWLLDLDGIRLWGELPAGRAAQNLARLCVSALAHQAASRSERLRFLKIYLGKQFGSEWKDWWRLIARLSLQKLARNQRRRRLVA